MRALRSLSFGLLLCASLTAARAMPAEYLPVLYSLCDRMLSVQITSPGAVDRGAFVCRSTNPQLHPLHSRAAEMAYALAVAYRHSGDGRYRDGAIAAGDWLLTKQRTDGAWGEEWPNYDGWTGTSADQLFALAAAYPLLEPELSATQRENWRAGIRRAADFVAGNTRVGLNFACTSAVALHVARMATDAPAEQWRSAEQEFIGRVLKCPTPGGLLRGEGSGVDLGYNIAQTIGYVALYGRLTSNPEIIDRAATLLRAHSVFIYPNGSVDNSWGTRSYKWDLDSGTRTAPGIYFTLALLADRDPSIRLNEQRCFQFFRANYVRGGWVVYGPDASDHDTCTPPCIYPTFTRAHALALAIEYGAPDKSAAPSLPIAATPARLTYLPALKVAVVRTANLQATVSAYGAVMEYPRSQVARGGSITNLWFAGYGPLGFLETSSTTEYQRVEPMHMPIEQNLLPLTPRVEGTIGGVYYSNLYETAGKMTAHESPEFVEVSVAGILRSSLGKSSGVNYTLVHRFYDDHVEKELIVESARAVDLRIIEPVVRIDGSTIQSASDRVTIDAPRAGRWTVSVDQASAPYRLTSGLDRDRYWAPDPGLECYPIVVAFAAPAGNACTIQLSLRHHS